MLHILDSDANMIYTHTCTGWAIEAETRSSITCIASGAASFEMLCRSRVNEIDGFARPNYLNSNMSQ